MSTKVQTVTRRQKPARTLSKEEILRYSRHLIMPEVGMEGQLKLKNAKVLMIGTGGLGAPLGLYLAAAGVGKLGIVDFDVVDFTNLQRQVTFGTSDVGKSEERKRRTGALVGSESGHSDRSVRNASDQRERARTFQGLRHHRRRHRQFPDALSGERCVRPAGQAQRLWLDLPVRGADHRIWHAGWPVLSLPVSRAASAGPCAFLRRRRRAGCAAGHRRIDSGHGNDQADSRQRRQSRRPVAAVRCARHEVPRTEAAQESRLPDVRRASHHQQADRLRRILRHARRRSPCAGSGSSRNHAEGTEGAARQRRRSLHPRCARAARIPDLQSPRNV